MWYYPGDGTVFSMHHAIRMHFVYIIFPPVITDDDLAFAGIYPLVYEPPQVSELQVAEPAEIIQIDGQWTQTWSVRDKTPEEIELDNPPVDPDPEQPVQSGN